MSLNVSVRARVGRTRRSLATALRTLRNTTDYERWRNPSDAAYQTADRNQLIARFIPPGSSVLDLGAGKQELKNYLPPGCDYQPCGLLPGPDVLPCDFNADRYPLVERRHDVLVASGLLEFLRYPERFLARLPEFGDVLLMSYRVRPDGSSRAPRLASGYLSHLLQDELEEILTRLGYDWEQVEEYVFARGGESHVQPIYRVRLLRSA